ncbi:MAG TPA: beta-L-arabinofuranosidase domain-containing protein, partial [Anaerolineales bacterium]|nr:beta-L-arabinofuranosidase domain-containing protein [Anaerolineales bacterium]
MMEEVFRPVHPGRVKFGLSMFQKRFELNRRYLMSLRSDNLLRNHYLEAGLWSNLGKPEDCHWGWESPTSLGRGEFVGNWLSAAARIYAATGDAEIKAKADWIVSELGRCQAANGGEWVGSVPEKALGWKSRGLPLSV